MVICIKRFLSYAIINNQFKESKLKLVARENGGATVQALKSS